MNLADFLSFLLKIHLPNCIAEGRGDSEQGGRVWATSPRPAPQNIYSKLLGMHFFPCKMNNRLDLLMEKHHVMGRFCSRKAAKDVSPAGIRLGDNAAGLASRQTIIHGEELPALHLRLDYLPLTT